MKGFPAGAGLMLSLLMGSALVGCGSSTVPSNSPSSSSSSSGLKGNWLITGTIPTINPGFTSQAFTMTMSLDIINNEVVASVSDFYPCTNGGAGGAGGLPAAAIAADGSFTLQTLAQNTISLTVHGTVPQTAGAAWSGTYAATNANTGCTPISGSFTAIPIAQVSGTFVGVVTLGPQNSALLTAPTFTAMLQQGGAASLDTTAQALSGISANSVNALSGTLTVQGSACFTSGTAAIPEGVIVGDSVFLTFTMNDGSTLNLNGSVKNTAASVLVVRSALVTGGTCSGWFGASSAGLTRQ